MTTKRNEDLKVRRKREVDMSPPAIAARLRRLESLFVLGLSLRKARRIGKTPPG